MVDITKIEAASFLPGLQNVGQVSGSATINGYLHPSGTVSGSTSNLVGSFIIPLSDSAVINSLRVNLPDSGGLLATKWFPVMGTVELLDETNHFLLILYVSNCSTGRQVDFNFVNQSDTTGYTASNYRILIYGHLFTYPWG